MRFSIAAKYPSQSPDWHVLIRFRRLSTCSRYCVKNCTSLPLYLSSSAASTYHNSMSSYIVIMSELHSWRAFTQCLTVYGTNVNATCINCFAKSMQGSKGNMQNSSLQNPVVVSILYITESKVPGHWRKFVKRLCSTAAAMVHWAANVTPFLAAIRFSFSC